jgi:hypothetical protein
MNHVYFAPPSDIGAHARTLISAFVPIGHNPSIRSQTRTLSGAASTSAVRSCASRLTPQDLVSSKQTSYRRALIRREACSSLISVEEAAASAIVIGRAARSRASPSGAPDQSNCQTDGRVVSRIPMGRTASSFAQRSNERWECPSSSRMMSAPLPQANPLVEGGKRPGLIRCASSPWGPGSAMESSAKGKTGTE